MLKDVRSELTGLWSKLSSRAARRIMFVSAHAYEDTSSISTSFALLASERCDRPVWLIDADLVNNPIFASLDHGASEVIGRPGRAYDASLGSADGIYEIYQPVDGASAHKLLTVYDIPGTSLFVTRMRNEHLTEAQSISLKAGAGWWAGLRSAVAWAVVDAPPLGQTDACLSLAADMDGVILVVEADRTSASHVKRAQSMIEQSGGKVLGVVMNNVGRDALRQARR